MKASILIPVYNMREFVRETLESVKAQSFDDWECIIVNDGSTDDSEDVIMECIDGDGRFKYFRKENGGVASARNFAAAQACGEYLLPLDPDDLVTRDYLRDAVAFLDSHPDYALYVGRVMRFGVKTGYLKVRYRGYRRLLRSNGIQNSSVMRRVDFLRVGGYDTTLPSHEDWEFFIRLLYNNGKVYNAPQTGLLYRIRASSRNGRTRAQRHQVYGMIYRKNRGIYRKSLVWLPWRHFGL